MMERLEYDVVVPTLARPSLAPLLASLARSQGPPPRRIYLVDDRRERPAPPELPDLGELSERVEILSGPSRGPAAARNRGWIRARAPWVAFLDDDVRVSAHWRADLCEDLAAAADPYVGSQGHVHVPLPHDRRPTDWERNVRGLEGARWITADCAYRREALCLVGGFDERFPHAYREDTDLALRLTARGMQIAVGSRWVEHPVGPSDPWISVRLQRGNADDALMRALHGPGWYEVAGAQTGRFAHHVAGVACACAGSLLTLCWAALTARFAWERIAPGPKTPKEIATMAATSVVIPFCAVYHRLAGAVRAGRLLRRARALPSLVLFDRDGTLIVDPVETDDPEQVTLMPGAEQALQRLRGAGVPVGVVTNQHRIAEGRLSAERLAQINARVERLVGPIAVWAICPHLPDGRCGCRKPEPGLVLSAARALDVDPQTCVVVGDIGSDMGAAASAGARAVLVPTQATRPEEIAAAPVIACSLLHAVERILDGAV